MKRQFIRVNTNGRTYEELINLTNHQKMKVILLSFLILIATVGKEAGQGEWALNWYKLPGV